MAHPLIGRLGLIALVVGPAVVYKSCQRLLAIRRLQRLMRSRIQHSPVEFAIFFPVEMQPIAVALRQDLEEATGLDLGGLQPGDHLNEDLQLAWLWRQAMLDLITSMEERFDIALPDQDTCLAGTVNDFVELVQEARAPQES